jgi:hypothetical protein
MIGFIFGNITGFMAGVVFMIMVVCHITRDNFR